MGELQSSPKVSSCTRWTPHTAKTEGLCGTMAIGQSSRSLSRCLRRLMHVNDPDFFRERSVVVCSDDIDAFPSNNSHENTRSLHSAFAAKNDCVTPTGGHVHHCTSMITDHVAIQKTRQDQPFGTRTNRPIDCQVLGMISSCSSRATRKDCIAAIFSRQPYK